MKKLSIDKIVKRLEKMGIDDARPGWKNDSTCKYYGGEMNSHCHRCTVMDWKSYNYAVQDAIQNILDMGEL